MNRPLILLTNDDGYGAPSLRALRRELERFADVVVCAPVHNQSAVSHGLTLGDVLRLHVVAEATFALSGTPADCVYVAVNSGTRVLPRPADMVVSGMNTGPNLGVDLNYSGTVAGAREGALNGLPAMAISADRATDVEPAAAVGARLVCCTLDELRHQPPAGPVLLNVNIPPGRHWCLRVTRQGGRPYEQEVVYRTDPRGREYLWIGSSQLRPDPAGPPDSDIAAFHTGCVSITPLTVDMTTRYSTALAEQVAHRCAER